MLKQEVWELLAVRRMKNCGEAHEEDGSEELSGDLAIEHQEKETRHHLSARTMSTLWYPSVVTGSWRRNKFGCR